MNTIQDKIDYIRRLAENAAGTKLQPVSDELADVILMQDARIKSLEIRLKELEAKVNV